MANRDIVTRTGKGAALTAANHDQNMNSLAGSVDQKTGTTYTVVYTDQGKTIELDNATMTCTIDEVATIAAAIDTDNWFVAIKNINAADATIVRSGTDTFDGETSLTLSQNQSVIIQTNGAGDGFNVIGGWLANTFIDWLVTGNLSMSSATAMINLTLSSGIYQNQLSSSVADFILWAGAYFNAADVYRRTGDGGAKIAMATGSQDGSIELRTAEANAGSADDPVDWETGPGLRAQSGSTLPELFDVTLADWFAIATAQSVDNKVKVNGSAGTMEVFVSSGTVYTGISQVFSFGAHGLSGVPHEFAIVAECLDNSVDTWATVGHRYNILTPNNDRGLQVWASDTEVYGKASQSALGVYRPTTGAIEGLSTASDWKIYVTAKYYA